MNFKEDVGDRVKRFPYIYMVILIIVTCWGIFSQINNYISSYLVLFLIFLFVALFIEIFFMIFYLPLKSCKKGIIRVVFAIEYENEKQKDRLKSDLKSQIDNLLFINESIKIETYLLSDYYVQNIKKSEDKIKYVFKINKRLKSTLFIIGEMKERGGYGEENNYVINHNLLLIHNELNPNQKGALQNLMNGSRFDTVFPQKKEIEGFQITANNFYINIHNLVGVALLFSDYVLLAFNIHLKLLRSQNIEINDFITDNLKILVSEESDLLSKYYLDNRNLLKAKEFLNINESVARNKYGVFILYSMYFYLKTDFKQAYIYLKKSSKLSLGDYVWRFNKAYILLMEQQYRYFTREVRLIEIDCKTKGKYEDTFFVGMIEFTLQDMNQNSNNNLLLWLAYLESCRLNRKEKSLKYINKFLETNLDENLNNFTLELKQRIESGQQ